MQLIRQFAPETAAAALEEWLWLPGLDDLAPLAFSAFGDAFLYTAEGVWFLDTIEGTLTREWNNPAELQVALNTIEGEDRFLLGGLLRRRLLGRLLLGGLLLGCRRGRGSAGSANDDQ